MALYDPHPLLAKSNVATAPTPTTSGTTLVLTAGQGSRFPDPSLGNYNATICPVLADPDISNSEIVRVTAKTGDTLTITRTQEGSTARSVLVGDRIFASITPKTLTDVETQTVPYTGATALVDLGTNLLRTTELDVPDAAAPTKVAGHALITSFAQSGSSRLRLTQNMGSTDLILGRDNTIVVHNTTGGTITKGSAVRIIFFASNIPSVVPAIANVLSGLPAIGIAVDNIAAFGEGLVMKLGIISGLNTSAWAVNDVLYVSPTTAGALTNVRPSGTTNYVDAIALVFNSDATNGQILVRAVGAIQNRETGTNAATWTGTNVVGSLFTGPVTALKSATTSVDVSAATAPTAGQVLTATNSTTATWQTPSAGVSAATAAELNTGTDNTKFATALSLAGGLGWQNANETWTYSSVDAPTGVITIPTDGTIKYSVGMRVKFTQTTVKYGIITAIAATTMTIYTGTGTALTNAAISANFYSMQKTPFGFPLDPTVWSVIVTDTTNGSQSSPTASQWYNISSVQISVPIGGWFLSYKSAAGGNSGGGSGPIYTTLSTANNSESDPDFTEKGFNSAGQVMEYPRYAEKNIVLAAKTTYFYNTMQDSGGVSSLINNNGQTKLVLKARCAYL